MKTEIRAVVLGHLTITMPAIVIIAATVRFLLYTYGPIWTFVDPGASVLAAPNSLARFSYYLEIVPVMPTFRDLYSSDPARVLQQMLVVAPFYSGVAYSLGAFLSRRRIFDHFVGSSLPDNAESRDTPSDYHTDAVTSPTPPSESST